MPDPALPPAGTDLARMKAILALGAAVAFALSPVFAGGFGGFDPAAFPVPQVRPPAQPAAWAFAIWVPIYLGLIAHAAVGLLLRAEAADWDRTRWPLIASLVPGAVWIPAARESPVAATLLLWVMLGAALLALLRAPARDPWLARAPLGLYAGWLTAAAPVSLAVVLAGQGIAGAVAAAALALVLATALAALMLARAGAPPAYGAAVAWAAAGIVAANLGAGVLVPGLAALAFLLVAALALRARA